MPLRLVQRHGGKIWYLRGTIRGFRVDESTGTVDLKAAEEIRIKREAVLLTRSIHGDTVTRTFSEAAISYMQAGGERELMTPILKRIGRKKLSEVNQGVIDDLAERLFGDGGPATRNRKVYTPVSAVLHHAARKGWMPKPVIARPKEPRGRVRSVTREEAVRLIQNAAAHLKPLVLFLFSTGCRLGEALKLKWEDVDLSGGRVTFWETKNGEIRVVPMPPEAVAALANMPNRKGHVFRTQKGAAYEDRKGMGGGQVKTAWAGMCKRAKISDFSPHDCRHTFATWYLRDNPGDHLGLMKVCGWKSVEMVKRYAHLNVEDVTPRVNGIWGKNGDPLKQDNVKAIRSKGKT